MGFWFRGREGTRDQAIRMHLPTRQVFFELARRVTDNGGCTDPRDVALLDPFDELPQCLADPPAWSDDDRRTGGTPRPIRRRRAAVLHHVASRGAGDRRDGSQRSAPSRSRAGRCGVAWCGRLLGRCPWESAGGAGPADPNGLEPGDILVAPLTDPAWTPLFLPAAAVVVNVGALMSHAIIVSRELGIPCAVSVEHATERIPDGALVEVDGAQGTVRIISTSVLAGDSHS